MKETKYVVVCVERKHLADLKPGKKIRKVYFRDEADGSDWWQPKKADATKYSYAMADDLCRTLGNTDDEFHVYWCEFVK